MAEGCGEGSDPQLVESQRPGEWVMPDPGYQGRFACDDAGLWASKKLVPRKHHNRRPGGEAFLRPGFPQCLGHTEVSDLEQATASDVLDHRHPMLPCQGRKVRSCHVLGEPDNPEVSGMHLEDCRGCRGDGICIVREPGAIRGSDLNKGRTTLAHHIRHPESATDFHQVPSGHDHFAPARQFGKREEQGTGAVVHGNGIEGLRC